MTFQFRHGTPIAETHTIRPDFQTPSGVSLVRSVLDEDNPHSQPHPQIENEASKKVQGIVQRLSFQTRLFAPDRMREKSIAPTMRKFRMSKVKVVRRPSV